MSHEIIITIGGECVGVVVCNKTVIVVLGNNTVGFFVLSVFSVDDDVDVDVDEDVEVALVTASVGVVAALEVVDAVVDS